MDQNNPGRFGPRLNPEGEELSRWRVDWDGANVEGAEEIQNIFWAHEFLCAKILNEREHGGDDKWDNEIVYVVIYHTVPGI